MQRLSNLISPPGDAYQKVHSSLTDQLDYIIFLARAHKLPIRSLTKITMDITKTFTKVTERVNNPIPVEGPLRDELRQLRKEKKYAVKTIRQSSVSASQDQSVKNRLEVLSKITKISQVPATKIEAARRIEQIASDYSGSSTSESEEDSAAHTTVRVVEAKERISRRRMFAQTVKTTEEALKLSKARTDQEPVAKNVSHYRCPAHRNFARPDNCRSRPPCCYRAISDPKTTGCNRGPPTKTHGHWKTEETGNCQWDYPPTIPTQNAFSSLLALCDLED